MKRKFDIDENNVDSVIKTLEHKTKRSLKDLPDAKDINSNDLRKILKMKELENERN